MNANFVELWRRHCLALEGIRDIVDDRVYPQHISSVDGASFPALSLFTLSALRQNGIVNGLYQMDSWSHNEEEARHLQDYLERLYHPDYYSSLPAGYGVKVKFLRQTDRRDGYYEDDIRLFHKISIYNAIWEAV